MKAVKDRLAHEPETEESIDDWGIMDDLWITGSGGLMLYRALRLKQPWEKTLRTNGHAYWSTSNGGAAAYDADALDLAGTVDVKIIAELPSTAPVDWNGIWESILHYHHQGENELRLDHGAPLIVRQVYVEGNEVQSLWLGKQLIS